MPIINDRYYANHQYGRALERARAAEEEFTRLHGDTAALLARPLSRLCRRFQCRTTGPARVARNMTAMVIDCRLNRILRIEAIEPAKH